MKLYTIPNVNIVTVEDADIVTLSVGENTHTLDFGKNFTSGVGSAGTGNAGSADWNNDFT